MIIKNAHKNKSVNGGLYQNRLYMVFYWTLKKKGYITITASTKNKRERLIAFTENGEIFASSILNRLYQMEENAMHKLGEEKRKQLIESNTKYYELLKEEIENG